jgi:hypothetical protein
MKLLSRKNLSLWIAFSIYAIVTGVLSLRHTMWRDELQLWLVGSQSNSLTDLIQNKRYEIRPYTWFLICWCFSRFTSNPEILKLFNYLLSVLFAFILLFKFKKNLFLRVIFLFGFLPIFGYSVIAEQYMLGLFIFLIVIRGIIENTPRKWLYLQLAILANIDLFCLFISVGLVMIVLGSHLQEYFSQQKNQRKLKSLLIGPFSYSIASAFSAYSMRPPSELQVENRFIEHSVFEIVKRINNGLVRSYFPFFNRDAANVLNTSIFLILSLIALIGLITLVTVIFRQNPITGFGFMISNLLLLFWMGIGYATYWWHFGPLFFTLFGGVLLLNPLPKHGIKTGRVLYATIILILFAQIMAIFSGPNLGVLSTRPYSNAKATAQYVSQICKADCTIIANAESTGASISAYLGGRSLYYVNAQAFGTFAAWRDKVVQDSDWNAMVAAAQKFDKSVLIASSMGAPPSDVQFIAAFEGAIWSDEDFYVYKFIP